MAVRGPQQQFLLPFATSDGERMQVSEKRVSTEFHGGKNTKQPPLFATEKESERRKEIKEE